MIVQQTEVMQVTSGHLIAAIGALASVVAVLWWAMLASHKKQSDERNEQLKWLMSKHDATVAAFQASVDATRDFMRQSQHRDERMTEAMVLISDRTAKILRVLAKEDDE